MCVLMPHAQASVIASSSWNLNAARSDDNVSIQQEMKEIEEMKEMTEMTEMEEMEEMREVREMNEMKEMKTQQRHTTTVPFSCLAATTAQCSPQYCTQYAPATVE